MDAVNLFTERALAADINSLIVLVAIGALALIGFVVLVFSRIMGAVLGLFKGQQALNESNARAMNNLQRDMVELRRADDLRIAALESITGVLISLKTDISGRLSLLEDTSTETSETIDKFVEDLRTAAKRIDTREDELLSLVKRLVDNWDKFTPEWTHKLDLLVTRLTMPHETSKDGTGL